MGTANVGGMSANTVSASRSDPPAATVVSARERLRTSEASPRTACPNASKRTSEPRVSGSPTDANAGGMSPADVHWSTTGGVARKGPYPPLDDDTLLSWAPS